MASATIITSETFERDTRFLELDDASLASKILVLVAAIMVGVAFISIIATSGGFPQPAAESSHAMSSRLRSRFRRSAPRRRSVRRHIHRRNSNTDRR